MGFWPRARSGGDGGDDGGGPSPPKAKWLPADDPGNPFGVPLLDLMENLQLTAMTHDPEVAARAVSWRPGMQREVEVDIDGAVRSCDLRYPAPAALPEGMLYRPESMEDKWVLAYRQGRIAAARSWTGQTMAVARAQHEGESLVVTEVRFSLESSLDALGDPIAAFDWLVRAHALGARVPFPVSAEGAERLAVSPVTGFSLYGRQLFCAAVDYDLGEPRGRLHSDGDLVAAVAGGDLERVRAVLAEGAPIDAPCRFNDGASALHLAILWHPQLIEPLLAAGADVNAAALRGSTPLMVAASAGLPRDAIARLVRAGADVHAADQLGFTAAHVAAQFGRVGVLTALVEHGASLSATTTRGLTPLHVATGTGQREAVEWMIAQGLDPRAPSPLGDPLTIAEENGHQEIARFLRGG